MAERMRRVAKWLVPAPLHRRFRRLGLAFDRAALEGRVLRKRLRPVRPCPHSLPGALVVSLTSWPPRYPTLHRTLASLLRQSVQPDRLILWIGTGETLPPQVTALVARGLEIRETRHIGPHTKLLPALAAFPDAFIVIADDDLYYPPDWLETLVAADDPDAPVILCHRAHRPRLQGDGSVAPFREWNRDVQDEAARRASADLIPTGGAGTLYPPGCLHPDVLDAELCQLLCPTTDDFWFWWQARRVGSRHRKIGGRFAYHHWPGSQTETLHQGNLAGGYDAQLGALIAHYGWPPGLAEAAAPGASSVRGG